MIRTLIVDGDKDARSAIRTMLHEHADVDVAGECFDGKDAVARIREERPDLVLLDVQLPGLDGFGVLESIGPENAPVVVFVTAQDEHALRAFRVHAADYLLKPVHESALAQALDRVRDRIGIDERSEAGSDLQSLIEEYREAQDEPAMSPILRWLLVRDRSKGFFVRTDEVDWIGTADNYLSLHVGSQSHLVRGRMNEIERRLDPNLFVRIHRQIIVNRERIERILFEDGRPPLVVLRDGTKLRVSRSYRPSFLGPAL